MDQYNTRTIVPDRAAKNFPRMDLASVHESYCHRFCTDHEMLSVQQDHVELFFLFLQKMFPENICCILRRLDSGTVLFCALQERGPQQQPDRRGESDGRDGVVG